VKILKQNGASQAKRTAVQRCSKSKRGIIGEEETEWGVGAQYRLVVLSAPVDGMLTGRISGEKSWLKSWRVVGGPLHENPCKSSMWSAGRKCRDR